MTGDDALAQRLLQAFERPHRLEVAEARRGFQGTVAVRTHGMAARAVILGEGLAGGDVGVRADRQGAKQQNGDGKSQDLHGTALPPEASMIVPVT